MESISDGALVQRPSYLVSAEPVERPTGIDVDDIKLDLSHEFSLVASSSEESALQSKDHVQVCLRIRPFTPSEKENDSQGCVYVQDSNTILLKDPQSLAGRLSEKCCGQMAQKFSFSKVFGPETTQKEFFEGSIMQLVKDFLRGENRLIFTYGVTNSGKTYTFQGTEENTGILPRTMNMLFHTIQDKLYQKMDLKPHRCRDYLRLSSDQMKEEVAIKNALLRQIKEVAIQNGSCDTSYGSWNSVNISDFEDSKDFEQPSLNVENTVKFSIWVSFFEIYNEFIYDLFVPVSSDKFQKRKMLRLSQDIKGCSFIKDLQWIQVSDSKEAYRLLKLGVKHQSFASTKLNSASSRSHSIFTIRTLQIEDSEVPRVTGVSELSLCDLAGSERSMKTQNEGERLRETGNINTSLLTLGKCINALRNSQKSKLQQHVPFRESKLTHYFQSFFNGKGKIYMIVNISQCCSAYDETFNVLKFSAVAQKVFVPDALNFCQEKPFGQTKSSRDTSFIANNADTKMLEMKRTTIEWERSLEDLIEDEDLVENPDEAEDDQMVELDVTSEEEKAVSKEEYAKLLSLIEDLKNKLINEKKEKLTLELKIRDELTQEFTQYLAQREADFKESLLQEREILEENSERRMAIFKDLVADFETSREEPVDETCTVKVESKESDNLVGIEDIVDSLQDDVTDIKKQAEIAHLFIASLADPQEAIVCLELKYNQVTAELAKIQEEYAKVQQELVKTQEELRRENKSEMCTTDYKMSVHELENANKKIVAQDQRIQELMDIIDQKEDSINKLQHLVSHMEDTFKGCDETLFTIKNEISKLNSNERVEDIQTEKDKENRTSSGRKRSFDDSPLQQEELPIKKGPVNISTTLPEEQKETGDLQQNISEKEAEIRDLQEEKERLQKDVLVMEKELSTEKAMKEELHQQIASLLQELSCSKEKTSVLNIEVQQIRSDYESAVSELHVQKTINQEQEEKVMELLKEIATTRQNITNKVAQIKMMQTKIDKLHMLDCVPQTLNAESQNLKDLLKDYPVDNLSNPPSTVDAEDYSVDVQVGESDTECFRRKSSFHCSIEAIWEECKAMVNISSNKSNQIQQLEQQIEKLHEEVRNVKEENNHLKLEISENKNQGDILKEKENIINQLSEELEGKTIRLAVEEHHVIESEKTLSEFTQQITSLKEKIKEVETILETKKDADNQLARLEQVVLEKESVILKLERNLKEFEENLYNSNKNTKELSDKEAKLKEEVTQLMNNLQNVNNSLQVKDKENEDNSQKIKKLKEELSANSALTHKLKEDLQRKEEDYVDLKEKFADAKKQIEQVQKEISIMRDQEKLLRNKVNELEKIKNQFSQELDVKQRTIQQLKEQLSNQNTEEVIQQYQNICKDLVVKEKIIEGMRATMEEQEQTQVEMEEMLEARSEEVAQLTSELEEWKEKCKNLETKISQEPQNPNQSDKDNRDVLSEELNQLQEALQESEEKHQGDRKKWLEEKTMLITQAKEAENLRNREMKKYVEDRARCLQLHNEVERLTAQLANKDDDLQKWREERDKLVLALEVQLKTLISSNMQKDNEIEQLKRTASEDPGKDYKHTINELKTLLAEKEDIIKKFKGLNCENSNALQATALTTSDVEVNIGKQLSPNIQEKDKQNPDSSKSGNTVPNSCKSGNVLPPNSETVKREMSSVPRPSDELSVAEIEDGSVVVLDSSEVSTENEHMTRFPKSELEIQFTPLQPNKMSVKHPGSSIPVTVKISKPRKRKSSEMEENLVKYENKKNVTTPRTKLPGSDGCSSIKKEQKVSTTLSSRKACYSLRNQEPTLSRKSSTKKKDGTLQKFGEFLQHSPTILHSKAKKLIEKMSPSKPAAAETGKENGSRPKRAKRKLYTSEISSPLDVAGQVIFMDQKEKESDHQILKRRLRTRTAK